MIRSRIVTKIGHLTHNQVVAGSSPAGPRRERDSNPRYLIELN